MPMVYVPGPGDVIAFNRKRGILVRSNRPLSLSFFVIDNAGKVTPDPQSQNKEPGYFNTAVLLGKDEELTNGFAIAVNAIKSIPSAVAPL